MLLLMLTNHSLDSNLGFWCASAQCRLVFLSSLLPSPFLLCGEEFQAVGPHNCPPLAYESSWGAVSEAGKREGRRVIKLPKSVPIRTLISLMLAYEPMWHLACSTLVKSLISYFKSVLFSALLLRFYSWTLFKVELLCLTISECKKLTSFSFQPLALTLHVSKPWWWYRLPLIHFLQA